MFNRITLTKFYRPKSAKKKYFVYLPEVGVFFAFTGVTFLGLRTLSLIEDFDYFGEVSVSQRRDCQHSNARFIYPRRGSLLS
jgi:hypothetical protein